MDIELKNEDMDKVKVNVDETLLVQMQKVAEKMSEEGLDEKTFYMLNSKVNFILVLVDSDAYKKRLSDQASLLGINQTFNGKEFTLARR